MKKCITCGEQKENSMFSTGRNQCKACRSKYNSIRQNNKYIERKDTILHQQKIYRNNNPEKRKAVQRKYYEANKDVFYANKSKRRAAKAGNGGSHTAKEWQQILKTYGYKCLRCGTIAKITKDHVIPIALGGTDNADNLQPLCEKCNLWKHARFIDYR